MRETLTDMGVEFVEEDILEDALFKPDFHIPSLKLLIEINGIQHFYPYTSRFNNFTNLKNKTTKSFGYSTLHLNSWKLEGLIRGEDRAGIKSLIQKTLDGHKARNENPPE